MSRRTILMFVLGVMVLSGLVAGLFTGSIEQALGRPQTMANAQTRTKTNTPVANTPGTAPANTNQPMMPNQQASVLAADTFQRQNQALWGIASDGRQWGGDANSNRAFSINGMKGQIAGVQGTLDAVIGVPTNNVDITMSGSINQFGNGVNFGAVLRWTDANNWYKAFIDGAQLVILRDVNGQKQTIAQMYEQTSAGVVQNIRFRAVGAMLFAKAWPNGTTEPQKWLVVTDNTFTTGMFGIRVSEQPTTMVTITSFNATAATLGNGI